MKVAPHMRRAAMILSIIASVAWVASGLRMLAHANGASVVSLLSLAPFVFTLLALRRAAPTWIQVAAFVANVAWVLVGLILGAAALLGEGGGHMPTWLVLAMVVTWILLPGGVNLLAISQSQRASPDGAT